MAYVTQTFKDKTSTEAGTTLKAEHLNHIEAGIVANEKAIGNKQDALKSGTNIKTVNGQSILGSGNIQLQDEYNISVGVDIPSGLRIAVLGPSNSTKLGRNVAEIVVEEEDVGVELSAYATYYDIGTTIGGHEITSSDVGEELTFTPTADDVGKEIGKPNNYAGNNSVKVWWQYLEEQFNCEVIPVTWSGAGMSSHEESKSQYKCAHAFHESQIRKCGIRTPGTMDRTAPDIIILWRAGNDMTHEPYCTLTKDYFDNKDWHYPTTDLKEDGTYGTLEAFSITIQKLRTTYPLAPIVLGTQALIKRIDYDNFPVTNGLYSTPQLNTELRKGADFFGIHTIDFDKAGITFENIYPNYATDSATTPVHPNNEGHKLLGQQAIKDLISKLGMLKYTISASGGSGDSEELYTMLSERMYSGTWCKTGISTSIDGEPTIMVSSFQYAAPEKDTCTAMQCTMGSSGGFFSGVKPDTKKIYNNQTQGTYVLEEGHNYFMKTVLSGSTVTTTLYDGVDDNLTTPLDSISRSVTNVSYEVWVGNCHLMSDTTRVTYGYNGLKMNQFLMYNSDNTLVFSGTPAKRNADGVYGVYDSVSGKFLPETSEL